MTGAVEASVLAELLARVEASTANEQWVIVRDVARAVSPDDRCRAIVNQLCDAGGFTDAALALCDRVLANEWPFAPKPLWTPKIAQFFNGDWEATLYRADTGRHFRAVAKTPALALVSALLETKLAQAASPAEPTG